MNALLWLRAKNLFKWLKSRCCRFSFKTRMENQHRPYICKTKDEYEALRELVISIKLNNSLPELYFSGLLVRICETLESLFYIANGAHDNTLLILFRHLYENVVRIRYLALIPDVVAVEFELIEIRGHLGIIGRVPKNGESIETTNNRQKYLDIEKRQLSKLRKVYKISENKNPPNVTVEHMCKSTNMEETYTVYRLFSQFEHSTGVGLMGTVIDKKSRNAVKGKALSKEQIVTFWDSVAIMIGATKEAIEMLEYKRSV